MERRQFFKNIGNLGALSASAATLGLLSEKAHADQAAAYGGARGEALNGHYLDSVSYTHLPLPTSDLV